MAFQVLQGGVRAQKRPEGHKAPGARLSRFVQAVMFTFSRPDCIRRLQAGAVNTAFTGSVAFATRGLGKFTLASPPVGNFTLPRRSISLSVVRCDYTQIRATCQAFVPPICCGSSFTPSLAILSASM